MKIEQAAKKETIEPTADSAVHAHFAQVVAQVDEDIQALREVDKVEAEVKDPASGVKKEPEDTIENTADSGVHAHFAKVEADIQELRAQVEAEGAKVEAGILDFDGDRPEGINNAAISGAENEVDTSQPAVTAMPPAQPAVQAPPPAAAKAAAKPAAAKSSTKAPPPAAAKPKAKPAAKRSRANAPTSESPTIPVGAQVVIHHRTRELNMKVGVVTIVFDKAYMVLLTAGNVLRKFKSEYVKKLQQATPPMASGGGNTASMAAASSSGGGNAAPSGAASSGSPPSELTPISPSSARLDCLFGRHKV